MAELAEGTTLLTWQGLIALEGSNPSLSAAYKEKANYLAFVRDEKDGALLNEYMRPRVGVEKILE